MTKIYLLKPYKNYGNNTIIEVNSTEANELIKLNIGRLTSTRDYLIKPQFNKSIVRGFKIAPKTK